MSVGMQYANPRHLSFWKQVVAESRMVHDKHQKDVLHVCNMSQWTQAANFASVAEPTIPYQRQPSFLSTKTLI